MERKHNVVTDDKNWPQVPLHTKKRNILSTVLAYWYRLAAPPAPLTNANFAQQEKVRHGRLAAVAIPIYMLFLLFQGLQMQTSNKSSSLVGLFIPQIVCLLVLFLNRKGLVGFAGILALILLYGGQTVVFFNYPGGLKLNNIYELDYTIMSDLIVLAFFSVNSLIIVFVLNVLEVLLVVFYAPHDAVIGNLLHTAPMQIFLHVYILQLFTALVLYIWARSTENALIRADRAEVIIAFERREKALREAELEQKRQLDAGIQQILQTHVAVANGDFKVRAPLHQDHVLWQVAAALNNLISRIQSLSFSERELRQQIYLEDERINNNYRKSKQTGTSIPSIPKIERIQKPDQNLRG